MEINYRLIEYKDIEKLRIWKNTNKQAFFHKQDITPDEQENWFGEYITRNYNELDYMFMVEYNKIGVGCVGYRLLNNCIDLYNIMLGNTDFKGKNILKTAMKMLWYELRGKYPTLKVTVKVLLTNYKMVNWYLENNWVAIHVLDNYILLRWDGGRDD
jgi:hypothetical protein